MVIKGMKIETEMKAGNETKIEIIDRETNKLIGKFEYINKARDHLLKCNINGKKYTKKLDIDVFRVNTLPGVVINIERILAKELQKNVFYTLRDEKSTDSEIKKYFIRFRKEEKKEQNKIERTDKTTELKNFTVKEVSTRYKQGRWFNIYNKENKLMQLFDIDEQWFKDKNVLKEMTCFEETKNGDLIFYTVETYYGKTGHLLTKAGKTYKIYEYKDGSKYVFIDDKKTSVEDVK